MLSVCTTALHAATFTWQPFLILSHTLEKKAEERNAAAAAAREAAAAAAAKVTLLPTSPTEERKKEKFPFLVLSSSSFSFCAR